VEYTAWSPHYRRLAAELGYPFEREEAAARELEQLLPSSAREDPVGRLRRRLQGRSVVVVGLGPGAGAPPLDRLPARQHPVLLAADGATDRCLRAGLVPEVVVTDLDGPVPSEIAANARGALVVVHAHGDNGPALREWVPQFPGELVGSWAGPPRAGLVNFGGFTDGDRAAYLAEALGASEILLFGFDFERVDEPDPEAARRKRAKLGWARTLLELLARASTTPLAWWSPDGTRTPLSGAPPQQ
jgi:uncharacterized Rossmann fold enzyme